MLAITLGFVLFLHQASLSQQCTTEFPVAYMCQDVSVLGPGVTLEVSTAAATNYSDCSCSLVANVSSFSVTFINNPNTTDCGTQLDLQFEDKSMQLKCGVPAGEHSSAGRTAQIYYTRDRNVENVDSNYCLSFHAGRSDIEFELTCVVNDQTTTGLSSSTTSTSTSVPTRVQSTYYNTTVQPTSTTTSQMTSTSNTVDSSTSVQDTQTTTLTYNFTLTTTSSITSTTLNQSTTLTITSTFTTPPNITSSIRTTSPRPSTNTTSKSNTTTPTSTITRMTNASLTTPYASTAYSTHIVNTTESSSVTNRTQQTTNLGPSSKPSTNASVSTINTTTVSVNTTTQSVISSTAALPSNKASVTNISTTSTESYINQTSTLILTESTEPSTQVTEKDVTNGTLSTEITKLTTTSSTHQNVTMLTTTTDIGNKSNNLTETTEPTVFSTTASNNITVNASTGTTTVTPSGIDTSNNETVETNTTAVVNTTNIPPNTKESTSKITTVTNDNTTLVTNTTDFENTTETTTVVNATTTGLYNETVDNATIATNETIGNGTTTEKPKKTTPGFWEPPIQNYEIPKKNNIVIILVPIAGILLLVFVSVVVYIMCKRSKEASKRTRVPNTGTKTDKNRNIMDGEKKVVNQKPENPRDMFVTQTKGMYPPKYRTENEKLDTDKTTLLDNTQEDTLLKQQFENTLNSTMGSTGKPKKYEPTEREMGVLEHLELSSIVIENDPDDPNRYFKKTDPGDWYRVIMKGKDPKNSDNAKKKSRKSRDRKSKSSGSENEKDERRHKKRGHRKRRSKSETGLGDSSGKHKSRLSSSESFDKFISDIENGTIGGPSSMTNQKVVMSKPLKEDKIQTSKHITSQSKQVVSKPVKEVETVPEPVKTRLVVSKPSNVRMPSPITVQNSKGPGMHTNNESAGVKPIKRDSFTSSSSDGSELNINQQGNTEVRQNQARNSLFGSGSKLNGQINKEAEDAVKTPVKRPDIVPPLNLTDTGDKVGRLEDGFEEFILSEC